MTRGLKFKNEKVSYIVKIAIFASLSTILYYLKFPIAAVIPIFPPFLEIQFSNLPAIIGGFILGPIGGVTIIVIRTLMKLPFSHTFFVGELADLLIGLSVVLVSSLIYKKVHNKKGGSIALICSSVMWIIVGCLTNWLIILPAYLGAGEMTINDFIEMMPSFLHMNEKNYMFLYITCAIAPFNLILSSICNIITHFVYKRVSVIINGFDDNDKNDEDNNIEKR